MVFLSGFVFPIENMPAVVQPVTYLIPLRYFLIILRGIFLKGVGLETFWPDALALLGVGRRHPHARHTSIEQTHRLALSAKAAETMSPVEDSEYVSRVWQVRIRLNIRLCGAH